MTLERLVNAAKHASYDYERKVIFRREALKFLRAVASAYGLVKGSHDIRFNPAGIAVSGDAILHDERFYLHINEYGVYWREVKGREDYTGMHNRQFSSLVIDARQVADEIKPVILRHAN